MTSKLIKEQVKEYGSGAGFILPLLLCYLGASQACAASGGIGIAIISILQKGEPRHRESKGQICQGL